MKTLYFRPGKSRTCQFAGGTNENLPAASVCRRSFSSAPQAAPAHRKGGMKIRNQAVSCRFIAPPQNGVPCSVHPPSSADRRKYAEHTRRERPGLSDSGGSTASHVGEELAAEKREEQQWDCIEGSGHSEAEVKLEKHSNAP